MQISSFQQLLPTICHQSIHLCMSQTMYAFHKKLVLIYKNIQNRTSLAQWIRIRLPIQGTLVRSLVQEDPTYLEATKPMCHNSRAWKLQLLNPGTQSLCPSIREATTMRSSHTAGEQPLLVSTRGGPSTVMKTQHSQSTHAHTQNEGKSETSHIENSRIFG